MIASYKKLVIEEKFNLKEMLKFVVMTRENNMSILNEYYVYLLYIYILTVIGFSIYLFISSASI